MQSSNQLNPGGREARADTPEMGPGSAVVPKQREEPSGKPATSPSLVNPAQRPLSIERPDRSDRTDCPLSHSDEYKMLREEIMQHMRDISRAQTWAVVAGGATYAWLVTHRELLTGPWRYAWFISPVIALACAVINLEVDYRMRHIAKYLQRIEEAEFGQDAEAPGWEHYKRAHRSSDLFGNLLGIVLWIVAVAGSFAVSWFCLGLPTLPASPK
jgi:hypothetical protein